MKRKISIVIVIAMLMSVVSMMSVVAETSVDDIKNVILGMYTENSETTNGTVSVTSGTVAQTSYNAEKYYGGYAGNSETKAVVKYQPRLSAGKYRVYFHKNWTTWGDANIEIAHKNSDTNPCEKMYINYGLDYSALSVTDANGNVWLPLGIYEFSGVYGQDYVKMTGGYSFGYGRYDAMWFEKIEEDVVILDEAQSENADGRVELSGADVSNVKNGQQYGLGNGHASLSLSTVTEEVKFTYYPKLKAGEYQVYVNRPRTGGANTTAMTASVTHANGTSNPYYTISEATEQVTNERWYPIGTYSFTGEYGTDSVTISTGKAELGIANIARWDAVKFVLIDRSNVILGMYTENSETTNGTVSVTSGTVTKGESVNYYGGFAGKSDTRAVATYKPRLDAGMYRVYMHKKWKSWGDSRIEIAHKHSDTIPCTSVFINYGLDYSGVSVTDAEGGVWLPLGTYEFSGVYGQDYVKMTGGYTDGYSRFDALWFEKVEDEVVIVDESQSENSMGCVEITGAGATNIKSGNYGIGNGHKSLNLSTINEKVDFTYYPRLRAGEYKVYVNRPWVGGANTTAMTATVNHKDGKSTPWYTVSEATEIQAHESWYSIGTYNFSGKYGEDSVTISTGTAQLGVASVARWDAVKFVLINAIEEEPGTEPEPTPGTDSIAGVQVSDFIIERDNGLRMPVSFAKHITPRVSVSIKRVEEDMEDIFLAIGEYNDDGRLVNMLPRTITSEDIALDEKKEFEITLPLQGESGEVRAFLWAEGLTPITEKIYYGKSEIFDETILDKEINFELATNVLKNETEYYSDYSVHDDDYDIDAIFYDGSTYKGNQTKVFAYIGIPKTATAENPVPGVVCVHGGQGSADIEWVKEWNDKGYAAIAMDLYGNGPIKGTNDPDDSTGMLKHPYAGPSPWTYGSSPYTDFDNIGMYHVVQNVIYAHNLLRSNERVDADKTGITGISWGGITTTTVMGIDNRFKFAAPIYGCGYLDEARTYFSTSFANPLKAKLWDPSNFAANAKMPVLYTNGNKDPHFSINSSSLTYEITENAFLSVVDGLSHGQKVGREIEQVYTFADRVFNNEDEIFIRIANEAVEENVLTFDYTVPSDLELESVTTYYITTSVLGFDGAVTYSKVDTYTDDNGKISVTLPSNATYCYATAVDNCGNKVSTKFVKVK